MEKLQFSVKINSSKENVWKTLWDDKSFRNWANIIDEGTYLQGEMVEGQNVQFLSASGYGVTSFIEKLIPNEYVFFKHMSDTKDSGAEEREKEWTGGTESYALKENDGVTVLTVETDVPIEMVEMFKDRLPKALERIKMLAEK